MNRAMHGLSLLIASSCCALLLSACGGRAEGAYAQPAQLHASLTTADYGMVVHQLYVSYFGRSPDSDGYASFKAELERLGAPNDIQSLVGAYATNPALRTLIDSFGTSTESQALYSGNTSDFVDAIYRDVLNRLPDADGKAYWVGKIDSGELTRANASLSIMAGALANNTAQGLADAALVRNKIAVSTYFSDSLTGVASTAYRGDAAAARVRAMLAGVRADTDTLSFRSAVDTTLAAIVSLGMKAHCQGGTPTVALFVDPALADGIRFNLERFATDLCNDGHTVIEITANPSTPPEVRAWMNTVAKAYSLAGSMLIGNIPHAYQRVGLHTAGSVILEEVISFQYYADLDGSFSQSEAHAAQTAHGPYSYDQHSGAVEWEQWIGVLPMVAGGVAPTVAAINRYLDRNHAYRINGSTLPRRFANVSEHYTAKNASEDAQYLGYLRNSEYSWTAFSSASDALLYINSATPTIGLNAGYAALSAGLTDIFVQDAHGTWSQSGQLNIEWASTNAVRTLLFWSNGCAVGDLDHIDNFLAALLYNPTSEVLVARGSTNNSGGMGTNAKGFFGANVAASLAKGGRVGDAIREHVNSPLIGAWLQDREFLVGPNVVLGDPSLKLRP